ncbi:protocadherin-17-like [Conger conger]|uniref:protocadherin-17-like n=1 Tax=Conger conger TaxID=82655 RepID=UPI002A5A21A5|nr:protocadherin-17-like [Conger conger]
MYPCVFFFLLLWARALTLKNLNYSVPEEQGPGTVIGNIAKDARLGPGERGKKSNFRVLENSAPHLIDVDPESGLLYTKQRIDRETLCRRNPKCQLSMEVFANDKEICMIKLEIQDINDNSPTFPSDQIDIDISENAAPGTRFPLASAHDPDAGENGLKTYQITRDDYNIFSLDVKSRGDGTKFPELVVERTLDREDRSRHTLTLTATDGGEYPRTGTMQINVRVTDSNDNSPLFEQSSYVVEIPENAPIGKVLIDLNATDLDEGNNGQVVYSFGGYTPDRVRELFSIDPRTGVIKIQGEIDYEESSVIEIDVQAKDLGPNPIPGHCKVTVKVVDRNDNWPFIGFVSVRQGAISEAAPPGTVIALVRVTDKDSGRNGQLQCRVLGNVPFKLEENSDNFYTVVTDRPLDREMQDEYNVTIVAKDNGIPPLNSSKSVTVKILDENDNAPRFPKAVYLLQVPENNIPGEYLGSVQAHDPDLGQNGTVSYSILPSDVDDVSIYTYVSVNPTNGAIYALRSFNYEQTKYFEFKVLAKDSGSPHLDSNATVRVSVLDVNDNTPVIVLPLLQNDTAEIHVPRNVGVGHIVTTVRAVDNDYGESGRLTYEISDGNDEHLFEMHSVTGEIRTAHPSWEEVAPVVELIIKVTDHGKPTLSAAAKLIIKAYSGPLPEGEPRITEEQRRWDVSLPLIVTLSVISIMLLAAMVTIAVKCKRENEIRTYNCRIAEYSHPQIGKGKKKKINKNDIMLVQSEVEERDAMNVMNVVSSSSLATSPMYFQYQTRLPLSSPRSEVMYLKPAANTLAVPQGHVGCHTSFTGPVTNTTETPVNRMSIIQTDNFPAESNYTGSRQQFVQSNSTFKDPERASLRDSGHGDSDQADSDQDTNKGSCCDMSAKEALKLKATSAKPQPLEQEQEECVNCTDECRVLGHSDRCWMPQFAAGNQAEGTDYRTNVFVPAGMEAVMESEAYETVSSTGKKTFCTFGKDRRDHTILVANVKPYLKAKRALSPLLQEVPSPSCSPAETCMASCTHGKGLTECSEVDPGSSHYGPPDGQYLSPCKQLREPPYVTPHPEHSSEVGPGVLEPLEHGGRQFRPVGVDSDRVVRHLDKLLQDCRGSEATPVRK